MRSIPWPGVRDVPALRELRFLQRLALAASSTLDGATLVTLVIAETTEATDTDVCSVYLLAPDGEHLVLVEHVLGGGVARGQRAQLLVDLGLAEAGRQVEGALGPSLTAWRARNSIRAVTLMRR